MRVFEPIMAVEIVTPRSDLATLVNDLLNRRSSAERVEPRRTEYVIQARVPMAELIDYSADLARRTEARARCESVTHTLRHCRYREAPARSRPVRTA